MGRARPILLLALVVWLESALHAQDTVRVREIYVPYSELKARTGNNPKGVVMTLDEYRKLLLDALRMAKEKPPLELPPVESAIVSAVTKGVVESGASESASVRLESRIKIRVTSDGWVRCDLGAPMETLGSVAVDGAPGWIVIEETAEPTQQVQNQQASAVQSDEQKAVARRRAFLLLRGLGEHEAVLTYSLPVSEREDRFTLEGPLVPAPASRVEVEVQGVVEATASPPFLDIVAAQDRSRLVMAAGGSSRFRIDWRRKRAATETESLLRAEHWLTLALNRQGSTFRWDAQVSIARRKTGLLTFTEPEGTTVVRIDGPLVHGWERAADGLRVALNEETLGVVQLRFVGVVNAAQDRSTFAVPALTGAFANTGFLGFTPPRDAHLRIGAVTAAVEIAAQEATLPPSGSPPTRRVPNWARSFSFASSEARVEAELVATGNRFESKHTLEFNVTEDGASLSTRLHLNALEGRIWRIEISLPPPWRFVDLGESASPPNAPPAHGLRHEVLGPEASRVLRIDLERPLEIYSPLDLTLAFELEGFGPDRSWAEKPFDVPVPAVVGAERSRTDVGVVLPESMDALVASSAGWRSLSEDEIAAIGLSSAAAVVSSRDAAPRIAFTLVHRPARGELRVVSHVLALEDHLRIRADLRVAIVDRPVDEISFAVPAPASANVVILGQGIKEVTVDSATGRRIARFARPWLGTRQFRVEVEIPHSPGTQAPVPDVQALPVSGSARFGGERFVVLQSRGAVEIETSPGAGITTADVDEVPSFAEPWTGGRIIAAYRFRPAGDPGTIRTTVHERAPVLKSLAREMSLTTVLGADGSVRTRAELLLAYSRETHLQVRLPDGSRCLSVTVNGETSRSIRPGARKEEIFIPLPPLSYAQVTIVYEIPDSSASDRVSVSLGSFGSLSLVAPVLPDMPVGQTRWTVYHPESHRFEVTSEAMRSTGSDPVASGLFAETFVRPMLAGRWPRISFLEPVRLGPNAAPVESEVDAAAPIANVQQAVAPQGQLQARAPNARADQRGPSPSFPVWPEGRSIAAEKLGGGARLTLEYRSLRFERFAQRGVFLGVLLSGWTLARRRSARRTAWIAFWGLLVCTAVPFAIDFSSPLLLVPLCEGLVALLLGLCAGAPIRWIARRRRAPTFAMSALVLLACSMAGASPDDGVLIPYDPGHPGLVNEKDDKVFVPDETFCRLWNIAHPDAPLGGPEVPAEMLIGNSEYELTIEGDTYRVAFKIAIKTFTDRWAAVPLLFDGRITRILIDGVEAGVAQARTVKGPDSIPFVELRGAGEHRIEGEVTGGVENLQGLYRASSKIGPGTSASLRALLPPGARLQSPKSAIVSTKNDGVTTATIDLGSSERFALEWSFPKVEGQSGSQAESRSFTVLTLTPEGHAVDRIERIRVTGRPLSLVEYRVLGAWQITDVNGNGVSDWGVVKDEGNPPGLKLRIAFAQPVSEADVLIRGRTSISGSGAASPPATSPLSSLSLIGAARQESFVGLRQSELKRFAQQSLVGMRRAAREELTQVFAIPESSSFDRIYHVHGAGEGEVIAIEPVPAEVDVDSDLVAFVDDRRAALTARSRYTVKGPGPQRHEVLLPDGWIVRSVQCEALRSWEILAQPRRLVIDLQGRAATGTEVTWAAERNLDPAASPLDFPRASLSAPPGLTLRETQRWSLAATDELELTVVSAGRFVPESLEASQPWVDLPRRASYRLALRLPRGEPQGQDTGIQVATARRQSLLGASIVSIARIAEDFVHVSARIHFRVRLGGRDRFRFQLPAGAELGAVETRNERSREIRRPAEGVEVEVLLQSSVSGEHSIDVAYQIPRAAGISPTILPLKIFDGPTARLTEVDQFVAVLQTGATLTSTTDASQLVAVEAQSLPFLPAGVALASLQPIFRATQLDWSLRLEEKLIEVTRSGAVVELAELTTIVGGDGTSRTRAVYTVRNKGLQFLLIEMPEASTLWGVTLNGNPVAVGQNAAVAGQGPGVGGNTTRRIRVPLEHVGSASLSLEVALQYEEPPLGLPSLRGSAELAAPRVLDTQVVETVWNLIFPDGYTLERSGGNMREVAMSVLYAKRTESLLNQLDKVSKTAQGADSSRLRDQAARELTRVEQALGDNLAELSANNRSAGEASQVAQIGRTDLESQWAFNDVMIQKARVAQESLRQSRVEREKSQGQKAAPSKEEQAFLDTASHLKHLWNDNRKAETPPAPGTVDSNPAANRSLDALLDPSATPSTQASPGGAPAAPTSEAQPALPVGQQGLKPLPDLAGAGLVPGLEAPIPKDAGAKFTFVNQGGDARVAFSFTREDVTPRLAAAAIAVLLPSLAFAISAWRRRKGR